MSAIAYATPLASIGARSWREHVGAVMQDDQLLSGSTAENISFFDATVDEARIVPKLEPAKVLPTVRLEGVPTPTTPDRYRVRCAASSGRRWTASARWTRHARR